ncbi:ubiquitin carboxyl-terminal hydrolase domain-containing protein [Hirsutella rhossiliensis]|uniref:Ubiquitin carboxyl-terminal hydrolase n=1 Tax=Hirsutella rhossiliensis TaxID=111463 RepID=A0A9P8MQH7_9HYPO|nr:ubiquitin carboxyl-terminal hydrolase domain-containing protein [Hirsutella rhossiliensis]KAH0959582.1 ubiquitin carboxyl-terminal hydrolase domain-containing protein [Hirsutella rhossiliensis]
MSGGPGGGPRRRQPQYMPQYHHQQQHMGPMYPSYVPYGPQGYYGMPPQFQNGGVPSQGYMAYQGYARSPPSMPQYVPMPPSAPVPIPPQTPSSSHSSQMLPPPTPPTPQTIEHVSPLNHSPVEQREPFRPPLPWFSCPDTSFPAKTPRSRRRRKPLTADSAAVSLPLEQHGSLTEQCTPSSGRATDANVSSHVPAKAAPSTPFLDSSRQRGADVTTAEAAAPVDERPADEARKQATGGGEKPGMNGAAITAVSTEANEPDDAASPKGPVAPAGTNGSAALNGSGTSNTTAAAPSSAFSKTNANSLAEAIREYQVGSVDKISFLEPRGLINTGNMCYMNSVLQVLMFCVPFHDFLDQVSKRAIHSFKSETPLVDAMIMFMHEYNIIDSAPSANQLHSKLKSEDLEKYGEPFTPEFVYEAIRQLARFASMRRGHQQDAEEFLGFLLQSLDDECTHIMGSFQSNDSEIASVDLGASQSSMADPSGDWLEVGRKQRAAVTRSSGSNSSTPITKIFGGLLRSEFRVPGLKDSITTEPYQPLQLDIGSPDVRNVLDALRGLTRPERLQGDFNSPRGKDIVATKQVFIESLPPVLILHLKRFQFDAEGHGTIKVWKKVGYPLELEIPREALSRQKRQTMGDGAMPRYRLISVVYHHGKNASGGHYTVDVRRQDGREWIRMDDTVLRRVRSEDVAEGGSEEEVKDTRKDGGGASASANRFGAMHDDDTGDEDGWKQVTASAGGNKRWSSVVNGGSNGHAKDKQQQVKESIKDNKVAYLLFYQRV